MEQKAVWALCLSLKYFHTSAGLFLMPRHSPLQLSVAFNSAEVSVLAGVVQTFADEFFGVE